MDGERDKIKPYIAVKDDSEVSEKLAERHDWHAVGSFRYRQHRLGSRHSALP